MQILLKTCYSDLGFYDEPQKMQGLAAHQDSCRPSAEYSPERLQTRRNNGNRAWRFLDLALGPLNNGKA